MESELRALRGVSQDGAPVTAASPPALVVLHDLLAALPADVRFQVSDVHIVGGQLSIEGQTRSHADADAIAERLRAEGRLVLSDPRSEQLAEQRVSFVINGMARGSSAPRTASGQGEVTP
jgi:hypothetical protein